MKTHHFLTAIATISLAGTVPAAAQSPLKVAWELTEGVQAPESAYFDEATGNLFISQIGEGGATGKDGDGWITKMTPDGTVVTDKWFRGLHAPKGMRSANGILWVADIDRLVGINIANAKTHRVINVPEAKFLNDVAIDARGTVYVSDMVASTIYQLRGDRLTKLAEGPELDSPNGLLVLGNGLVIAGWGKELNDALEVITPGRLLAYNLRNGDIAAITETPTGYLDGVEYDGKNGFFVTDWMAGTLYHITSKGAVRTLLDLPPGSADLAYLPKKNLLIIPEMQQNRVTAYDTSGLDL